MSNIKEGYLYKIDNIGIVKTLDTPKDTSQGLFCKCKIIKGIIKKYPNNTIHNFNVRFMQPLTIADIIDFPLEIKQLKVYLTDKTYNLANAFGDFPGREVWLVGAMMGDWFVRIDRDEERVYPLFRQEIFWDEIKEWQVIDIFDFKPLSDKIILPPKQSDDETTETNNEKNKI